jgi:hypothetical protein
MSLSDTCCKCDLIFDVNRDERKEGMQAEVDTVAGDIGGGKGPQERSGGLIVDCEACGEVGSQTVTAEMERTRDTGPFKLRLSFIAAYHL